MLINEKLGLPLEAFSRMCVTTKMLLSNIMGHAAELNYEKYCNSKEIKFDPVETDKPYDYVVNGRRQQVKRFETDGTNSNRITANLTKTHGDRSGEGAFYNKSDFDSLILYDLNFHSFFEIDINDIGTNSKYEGYLPAKFRLERKLDNSESLELLKCLKEKNKNFPPAIEDYRLTNNLSYTDLLEKLCNLTFIEIDSLFSEENFRLVTGAKGFAAEEHFNVLLENNGIQYYQDKDMYSKVDHWIEDLRIQVKTPHIRSTNEEYVGFKTHKSHGHGVKELYSSDEFDIVALFTGFEINENISRYFPASVKNEFIFIDINDIEHHPNHPGYLKRVTKVKKSDYTVNDLSFI